MSQPDDVERLLPDPESAHRALTEFDPEFLTLLELEINRLTRRSHRQVDFLNKTRRALWVGYARQAQRHGSWGDDYHAYHNEYHARELLADRIRQLDQAARPEEFGVKDQAVLALFAVTHDLRQREQDAGDDLVGPNEAASAEEARRILLTAGFDTAKDRSIFETLSLMIGGSTFSTGTQGSGGATVDRLVERCLNEALPDAADLDWSTKMMHLAADIDTANVAEPFPSYAAGAARLCEELEMRHGRGALGTNSAAAALQFLTDQQEAYFFDLQRFHSALGKRIFEPLKQANAPLLRKVTETVKHRFPNTHAVTGRVVIEAFLEIAAAVD